MCFDKLGTNGGSGGFDIDVGTGGKAMIDNLALGITHGLMLLAAFMLLKRSDLDREGRRKAKRSASHPPVEREPPVA